MRIGSPREIKNEEHRVGLTPAAVRELTAAGHTLLIESGAGVDAGFADADYEASGARLVASADELYAQSELIVKVKEPQRQELDRLRPDHVLFGYLHLAAEPELARALMDRGVTAIAYETVTGPGNSLPLLAPMSRIAGRMAVQVGAHHLEKPAGGMGVLLGGAPGVAAARVLVIGAGIAGTSAVEIAVGMQADVTVVDNDVGKLERLASRYENRVRTVYSTADAIARYTADAALVVGTVLVPGRSAPKLVTRDMVAGMRAGAVMVDVAIDQGGCFETSRPTTHADPVYSVDGVLHYCVTNIPGAVPRTATHALVNSTLPHVRSLADHGWRKALERDPHLAGGLNVQGGSLRHPAVAAELGRSDILAPATPPTP
ncbi:MAG: alanine dehydrogenase [Gammaproteobacteria bacterium]|nr:alanine dehydrogenase [Gammaproteobacteria bacterium]